MLHHTALSTGAVLDFAAISWECAQEILAKMPLTVPDLNLSARINGALQKGMLRQWTSSGRGAAINKLAKETLTAHLIAYAQEEEESCMDIAAHI